MKTDEEATPIVEEATDQLGAPDSQEEKDENWSAESLSPEDREQYERGVAAVDQFLSDERTARYKATDSNRDKLLGFLEEHELPLSFGGLYVAFEQLSEGGELELKSEQEDQGAEKDQSEHPDASRLATVGLARGTKSEKEPPEVEEDEPDEEPKTARGKKPTAWRNGQPVRVAP